MDAPAVYFAKIFLYALLLLLHNNRIHLSFQEICLIPLFYHSVLHVGATVKLNKDYSTHTMCYRTTSGSDSAYTADMLNTGTILIPTRKKETMKELTMLLIRVFNLRFSICSFQEFFYLIFLGNDWFQVPGIRTYETASSHSHVNIHSFPCNNDSKKLRRIPKTS